MRRSAILMLAAWFTGAAAAARAGDLQCRTYWKNSLSGMKAYTDCSDDPYYVPSESEGISWFYGFRRMNKFWDDKKDGLRYNRDFFLKTGMTPAEVDGLMRARDAGAAAAGQMASDKINLDLAGLASSELFVYSSTAAQNGLVDQFYSILLAQPQIAAKTTDKDRSELRGRLAKLSPDLARLRRILESFVSGETPRLGIGLDAFKAANTGAEEISPGVYAASKEQEAVPLRDPSLYGREACLRYAVLRPAGEFLGGTGAAAPAAEPGIRLAAFLRCRRSERNFLQVGRQGGQYRGYWKPRFTGGRQGAHSHPYIDKSYNGYGGKPRRGRGRG